MPYRFAADAVLLLHFAFIAFVVAGGFLVLRWPRLALIHVPAALWGAFVIGTHRICPLTFVENALRVRAGSAGYPESFIEHYVLRIVYPPGLTPGVQVVLAIAVVAINVAIYAGVAMRHAGVARA
jgi:uncharacterized protein DUF2784